MAPAPLDLLAIAAHPDDAELGCGGILARFARLGRRAGVLDLTRGEMGSRGTVADREQEAAEAAGLLGLAERRNAGLPDGGIDPMSPAHRLAVVRVIRELRPTLVLLPWPETRHPDHRHAARLGEEAWFRAGMHKLEDPGAPAGAGTPFRPARILYYMEAVPFEPTLVVDVTEDHAAKMRAVRAHRSQFGPRRDGEGAGRGTAADGDADPATYLSRPDFLEEVEARARHFGALAGFRYGEPLRARTPLPVSDPAALLVEGAR